MIFYNRDVCSLQLHQSKIRKTKLVILTHYIVSLISDTIIPLVHHVISRMEAGHVQLLR